MYERTKSERGTWKGSLVNDSFFEKNFPRTISRTNDKDCANIIIFEIGYMSIMDEYDGEKGIFRVVIRLDEYTFPLYLIFLGFFETFPTSFVVQRTLKQLINYSLY
jgi:hypothetical protein